MKFRLSLISDTLFYFFAWFFLVFIAVNFFIPRPYSYVLSTTFALVFTLFSVKISLRGNKKKTFSREKEKIFNDAMTELNLKPSRTVTEIFLKAFEQENLSPELRAGRIFLKKTNATAFLRFGFQPVTKAYIVTAFNLLGKDERAEIYSESFTREASDFARLFRGRVVLKSGKDFFPILEKHGLIPEKTLSSAVTKKPDFGAVLDKKRAKNYLVFGLTFIILSYFVPIKTYYLVFGVIFLIFALILRFFGKAEQTAE